MYYSYQWIDSYINQNKCSYPFISLLIPFNNEYINSDEYYCQLISYSSNSLIKQIYIEKWLELNSTTSLLYYFNIRSTNAPLGLYGKIKEQIHFWSKFLWLNGSFLECDQSKIKYFLLNLLEKELNDNEILSLEIIKQSLNKIELIKPRGEIDPIIYDEIINDYKLKFQLEIQYEFNLRNKSNEEYSYSLNSSIHQWENQMNIILNYIYKQDKDYYRFNNEQYQMLITYLTKQLINELLNENLLIEQIYKKNQIKIYQQWRKNLVEFHRNFILSDKFYIYRDITIPLMKQVFQIVFAFDYHFQIKQTNKNIFIYCQFPFDLNHFNFIQIAQDLFQKRTFIQQNMSTERFSQ